MFRFTNVQHFCFRMFAELESYRSQLDECRHLVDSLKSELSLYEKLQAKQAGKHCKMNIKSRPYVHLRCNVECHRLSKNCVLRRYDEVFLVCFVMKFGWNLLLLVEKHRKRDTPP